MSLSEEYARLELKFLAKVKEENDAGYPHAHMLSNFVPRGKADFVLIGMEPSLEDEHGASTCECIYRKWKNFAYSIGDYVLHFCARKYLCEGMGTYHLTDLSKAQLPVGQAKRSDSWARWKRWYPLLEEELQLVANCGAPVISIGRQVERFLNAKGLKSHVGSIVHYSAAAGRAQKRAAECQPKAYEAFRCTVGFEDIEAAVCDVLRDEPNAPSIEGTLKRLRLSSRFTEHTRKLVFSYKVCFERLLEKATCRRAGPASG